MMRIAQHRRGKTGNKAVLDLPNISAGGHPGAIAESEDVGVDRHGCLAEGHVQHDVRRLAADTGKRLQRLASARNLAAMTLDQLT